MAASRTSESKPSKLIRRVEPGGDAEVVLEEDERVAYAYLLQGKTLVGDVWLYNVAPTPDAPEWSNPNRMPFLNPRAYALEHEGPSISEDITTRWRHESGALEVDLFQEGLWLARLRPGARPGWSRWAARSGPLAQPLPGSDAA